MIGIIGGGVAGLSAAWHLQTHGVRDFVLLEAGDRLGGVARTHRREDFILEGGPESFLARKPAALELCRELGLESELIAPTTTRAAIWHGGHLHPLPPGWRLIEPGSLGPTLRSPLLSTRAKLDILLHWRTKGSASDSSPDESVTGHLQRRYGSRGGSEIAAHIAGPLLAGVFGGDADRLSWQALQPPAAAGSGPMFMSLRGGMGTLIERLESALPAEKIRRRHRVSAISSSKGGYRAEFKDGAEHFDAVILALPAWAASELLCGLDAELAKLLAAIPCASSVNVNLAFAPAPPLPPGSGFLVPGVEGLRLGACTFAHQKWPGRAPSGAGLVRLFYGEAEATLDDARLAELGRQELRQIVPQLPQPRFVEITRWSRAMPQYVVGHRARVEAIGQRLLHYPRLALAGNAFDGVGLPDCIASGRAAAQRVIAPAAFEAR